jgi:hypothetical protein
MVLKLQLYAEYEDDTHIEIYRRQQPHLLEIVLCRRIIQDHIEIWMHFVPCVNNFVQSPLFGNLVDFGCWSSCICLDITSDQ